MKLYKTDRYGIDIIESECVKITEKSATFINKHNGKEYRELLHTNYHFWHKSKDEAIKYLIERISGKIESLKKDIEFHEKQLSQII